MYKIKSNDTQITEIDKGFVVGLQGENLNIATIGSHSLSESLEQIYSLLAYTLRVYDEHSKQAHTREIHDLAVEQFSFMIDKFHSTIPHSFDEEVQLKAIEDGILQD